MRENGNGWLRRTRSRSQRAARRRMRQLESLEARHLLAADLIMSEVLASNDSAHSDDDGVSSDYIEIFNRGSETVDLDGWHLTDDLADRTQWTFPAIELEPGKTLLVYASGNDRDDPTQPLHTNFRISAGGEYLGLYEPDGRTVMFEFNELPAQYTDISYGYSQSLADRSLVTRDSNSQVLLPGSAAEGLATEAWTAVEFDDAAWLSRTSGLGFDDDASDGDFSPLIDANGSLTMRGTASSAYIRTEFEILGEGLPTYEQMALDVNFDDGFVAFLNGERIASINAPDTLAWDSTATQSNGGINDVLDYNGFNGVEGELTVNGDAAINDGVLQLTPPSADANGSAWLTEAVKFGEDYTFSASMKFDVHTPGGGFADGDSDGIGGSGMTFMLQSNDNNVLGLGGDNLGMEGTGSTFLAIELDSIATGLYDSGNLPSHLGINTNVDGSLATTSIERFNGNGFFANDPPPGQNFLYLWVDYVGETQQLDVYYATENVKPEVATLSTTINLAEHFGGGDLFAGWTASTTAAFNGHDVHEFDIITGIGEIGRETVTLNLNQHINKLQLGKNVLSFHGLNVDANDEDFLLVPELRVKEVVTSDTVGFFATPTPNAINGEATDPPAGGVTISEPTKIFAEAFTVTITAENANAVIRYTTDGTLPTETSEEYTGPLTITEATRLRARAFEPNRSPGPTTTSGYIQAGESLTNFEGGGAFESNLPLIIIDSFGERRIDSSSTTMVPSIGVFIDPGEDGRTSIFDTPDYAGRLGGRIRGQSSQGWAKKQYAIEFIQGDTDDSELYRANQLKDFDASIFGLPADSDWVLNGPYADKSQLNNYLTFNWSNEMGQYAPRAKLVEVFVNTGGDDVDMARDYRGTYVLLEKIKVNNDRVDIAGLDPSDNDGEAITGGYVWKKDKTGTEDLNIFTGVRNQEVRIVEPSCSNSGRNRETSLFTCESGEITDEQIKWLTDHLTEFEEALYGREFADPARGYAAYIDVDSWVDTWLLVEFTKNIDGFRLSTYYHKDRGGKIKQGPAWDYNLALGNANYLQGGNPEGWYGTLLSADQYPYWERLFEDPAFEHKVQERWHELREGMWSTENLHSTIDAAVNLISDGNPNLDQIDEGEPSNPVSRNYDRWSSGGYGTDRYHWPNCYFAGNWGDCPRESPLPNGRSPETYGDYIFLMKRFVELRAEWIDEQFAIEIDASQSPGLTDKGTQIELSAADNYQLRYTTDGTDPQSPLRIFGDYDLIGPNAQVQYLVPDNNTLVDTCDSDTDIFSTENCFINPAYTLGSNGETWSTATLGIGFDSTGEFDGMIKTDVGAEMKDINAGLYLRVEFDVTEEMLADASELNLHAQIEDGFIAYVLNHDRGEGVEVARHNASGSTPSSGFRPRRYTDDSRRDNLTADSLEFTRFDASDALEYLQPGRNVMFIQVMNDDIASEDFFFDMRIDLVTLVEQPSPSVRDYTGPLTIDKNTRLFVRGYDSDRNEWTTAFRGDYIVAAPDDIKITELNYNPHAATAEEQALMPGVTGDDFEFVEIKNVGTETVDLLGLQFDEGLTFDFGSQQLAPGEYGLVVRNSDAFELRYGTEHRVLGEFDGGLANAGETLSLGVPGIGSIMSFTYSDNDPWSQNADGGGATLELINEATPPSLQSKPYNWRGSVQYGGSPGSPGMDSVGVLINEVVSRTDGDEVDAIELINKSDAAIDVSGWWLTDSTDDYQKYQIPDGSVIPAGNTLVLNGFGTGENPAFGLSGTGGDDVWLTMGDVDSPMMFIDDVHFQASLPGESFSRYPDGSGRLAPTTPTLGATNAYPRVGNVVLSEVNYNPPAPSEAALAILPELDPSDLEFVEITNASAETVNMSDWRLRGAVDHDFGLNIEIAAGESVVIISFNPDSPTNANRLAAFKAQYGTDETIRIIGGYQGNLSSNGERLTLLSRDRSLADQPVELPLVIEDEVVYDNTGLWPTSPDGKGATLNRTGNMFYGNLATSWTAAEPTPGTATFDNVAPGNVNGDGMIDVQDIDLLCGAIRASDNNVIYDVNGDGDVNQADLDMLIGDILNTTAGDANLDGVFDSRDLVLVTQSGQYEDGVAGNASWATGDWNCDGEFTTSDFVIAFIEGGYVAAADGPGTQVAQLAPNLIGAAITDSEDSHSNAVDKVLGNDGDPTVDEDDKPVLVEHAGLIGDDDIDAPTFNADEAAADALFADDAEADARDDELLGLL